MTANKKLYKLAAPASQYFFRPNLFIWPTRTLFFGPIQKLALHSMGSIAINIGLYKPFYIRTLTGNSKLCRCAIIPAGCQHEIIADGNIVASLIVEKISTDFIHFKKRFPVRDAVLTELFDFALVDCFQKIYEDKGDGKK